MSLKKILYSAKSDSGVDTTGFVEAAANKDALQLLKDQGFSDIVLHDDAVVVHQRSDLEGLSEQAIAKIAAFEIKARRHISLSACLLESITRNWLVVIAGFGVLVAGYLKSSVVISLAGLVIMGIIPLLTAWNYKSVTGYNNLLNAFAVGDWTRARHYITQLRARAKTADVLLELDVREAGILASEGDLDTALDLMEKWRQECDESSAGNFEARIAPVYHAAGDYTSFVESMRQAFLKSDSSSMLLLDLAIAEARLGDISKAEELLDRVETEELPSYASPFLDWVNGLIALKHGSPQASSLLAMAVEGFFILWGKPRCAYGASRLYRLLCPSLVEAGRVRKS